MVDFFEPGDLDCELTITPEDGSESFTIKFPCGSVFDTHVTSEDEAQTTQLPMKYQVMRERAVLKPCCFWQESILHN